MKMVDICIDTIIQGNLSQHFSKKLKKKKLWKHNLEFLFKSKLNRPVLTLSTRSSYKFKFLDMFCALTLIYRNVSANSIALNQFDGIFCVKSMHGNSFTIFQIITVVSRWQRRWVTTMKGLQAAILNLGARIILI